MTHKFTPSLLGNPNCLPDRDIYHLLMKYYQGDATFKNCRRCLDLLEELIEQNEYNNHDTPFLPNGHSYHIVLCAFRDAAQKAGSMDKKQEALNHIKDIIVKLKKDTFALHGSHEYQRIGDDNEALIGVQGADSDRMTAVSNSPLTFAYLCAIRVVNNSPLVQHRDVISINDIMEEMIGIEAYHALRTDEHIDFPANVDYKILCELVNFFSKSQERIHLDTAKTIFNKMQMMNSQCFAKDENSIWDTNYPVNRLCNHIILGLVHYAQSEESKDKLGSSSTFQKHVKNDALYAMVRTNLLYVNTYVYIYTEATFLLIQGYSRFNVSTAETATYTNYFSSCVTVVETLYTNKRSRYYRWRSFE